MRRKRMRKRKNGMSPDQAETRRSTEKSKGVAAVATTPSSFLGEV
jgi:hypothetical protein